MADYRAIARRRLPRFLFDYLDGAALTERTATRNRDDLDAVNLRQFVMRDVSTVSITTTLFGQELAMPVILGPVGLAGMFSRRGEVQAAKAARNHSIPFSLSTVSICGVGEVASQAGVAPWFQCYMLRDRAFMRAMLAEAWAAGCRVLLLTADVAVSAPRYRDRQSGLTVTGSLHGKFRQAAQVMARPYWAWHVYLRGGPLVFGNIVPAIPDASTLADFWAWLGVNFDPALSWDDIAFVKAQWNGPVIVKGILEQGDAVRAINSGADAIIVSNHGGRQLEGACSTISALPSITETVAGRIPILIDGAIHSGADVHKALSLGADACLLGRAWAFALAAGGEAGVAQLLADLAGEIKASFALSGCTSVAEVEAARR
ncbi:L-lactate dehydrogenase [Sphingomonas sp.]|uniref:L-lactate dehydrogenase n=1 Tax=Sphingomonas sp. TaxID=28214 RepID=UPI0025E71D38|nr:L-lactate dehydrogenase [Sphingomonas sp.]